MATPAASLTSLRAPDPAGAELARRIRWLMLIRTVIISIVLGVSWWLSWVGGATSATSVLLSAIIAATYASTLAGALRAQASPRAPHSSSPARRSRR